MSKRVFRFESQPRPADAIVDGVKVSGEHNVQLQIYISHGERWRLIRQLLHELEKDEEYECFPFALFGDMYEANLANDEEPMPLAEQPSTIADQWDVCAGKPSEVPGLGS